MAVTAGRLVITAALFAWQCATGAVAGERSARDGVQRPAAESERAPPDVGTLTVIGRRPTSLPTQIPTTTEGLSGVELAVRVNATDSEDALKYFPSLLVRKRYVGDYDHAVLASRASGTGNSARSLVYADGILLSNLLGNGASFTPRWGLVTPEEIERVDVLYGPFSAAYPGNSVGAVVDYVTRMPSEREVHARIAAFGEDFSVYGTEGRFTGRQASVSAGDRRGQWSWWIDFNRLESDAHPIGFATKLLASGVVDAIGVPVTGAIEGRNPRELPWLVLGSTSNTHTVQDHAKLKLAYDFAADWRLSYTLGWWSNDASRASKSYLEDPSGAPVYSGAVRYGGRSYFLAPADLAPTAGDLEHWIHGLSLKSDRAGPWNWEVAASVYDYARDDVRSPTISLPAAAASGAGRIADQSGTGWSTLALRSTWRAREGGRHVVDFGLQRDTFALRTVVAVAGDWLRGTPAERFSGFRGAASVTSAYAQDAFRFADAWRATLGLRLERWHAHDGSLADAAASLAFPERTESYASPKAAIERSLTPVWTVRASVGRAVRLPTVAELYQGSIATNAIVNNDPDLEPEKSWTSELTAERELERGSWRATMFREDTRDALYSQTNVTVVPNVTNVQNVDRILTTGLEVAFDSSRFRGERLELAASVTYAHSEILANEKFPASVGKRQPRVPEWRANALATYRFGTEWSVTLGARYSGRQYNTLDNSDPNGFAYTGVSSFLVLDARVRYAARRFTASLGIDNLGDEEYWAFHPYTQRSFIAELGTRF